MRVLVDSTFPASTAGPQTGGHHIERYTGPQLGDAELVALAGSRGFDAVVLLGTDALAGSTLAARGVESPVLVAATASDEPDAAEIAVKSNLVQLSHHSGVSRAVIIRKNSVVDLSI